MPRAGAANEAASSEQRAAEEQTRAAAAMAGGSLADDTGRSLDGGVRLAGALTKPLKQRREGACHRGLAPAGDSILDRGDAAAVLLVHPAAGKECAAHRQQRFRPLGERAWSLVRWGREPCHRAMEDADSRGRMADKGSGGMGPASS